MPPTIQQLGLDRLSVDDRLALAEELWESVRRDTDHDTPTKAQRAELESRLADSIARPNAVVPWETVKAEALKRVRK